MDPRIPNAARLQQQKNYPAAERIYRQILRSQPKDPDALLLLGLLLHETGRQLECVETLKKAVVAGPNRPEVHQTLVSALVAMRRLPEAIEQAREVVRLRPMAGDAHHAVARLLSQSKDFLASLPFAHRSTELEPRSAAFLLTLSRVYLGLEDHTNAMAALDRALSIDAKNADVMIDKGQLLQGAGQMDKALPLYQESLKLHEAKLGPDHPDTLTSMNNLA